ncbi:hypothetical protein GOQ29_01095 [Clostridium sp. D2Q-14]|uniref:hypothetical protein n=1 Tax=Anaeromonas gelatinilytica TaxID=2683194 RepID=UPI00193B7A52|nr:hypothetical protein [Anaeromonas gelatinilytica]MBS4534208.1 hypothetical protein [Anaeromonas gelatinilytica]
MIIYFLKNLLYILLSASILGYILVVIKEKIYLKNNTIVLDNKVITNEVINETDINEFLIGNLRIRSGDEVSLILNSKEKFKGIIIGAKKREKLLLLATYSNEILRLKVNNIMEIKVVSKYGKFF